MKHLLRWLVPFVLALGLCQAPSMGLAAVNQISSNDKSITVMSSKSFAAGDDVKLRQLTSTMKSGDTLKIIINNPGGDAFVLSDMVRHVQDLKSNGVKVVTEITGWGLSAGAFLWSMGNERIVHKTSIVMFHQAYQRGPFGSKTVCTDDKKSGQCFILANTNAWFRQILLDIIHDTETVNKLMDIRQDNFFTGQTLYDMGVATQLK